MLVIVVITLLGIVYQDVKNWIPSLAIEDCFGKDNGDNTIGKLNLEFILRIFHL